MGLRDRNCPLPTTEKGQFLEPSTDSYWGLGFIYFFFFDNLPQTIHKQNRKKVLKASKETVKTAKNLKSVKIFEIPSKKKFNKGPKNTLVPPF